jgi:hypothetical protein
MSMGILVSVQESIRKGLVRAGGDTEAIMTAAEREFGAQPPRTSVEAFEMLDRAAKSVNPTFAGGVPADLQPVVAGQDKLLLNARGVKTLVKANGEIIVTNATGNVIQHLVPPP